MEPAHALGAQCTRSASREAADSWRSGPVGPAELYDLIGSTNTAATIPLEADHAIWEDACRQILADARGVPDPLEVGGPKTVIVAEADDLLRQTICEELESAGYRVLRAEDGTKALGVACQGKADLVLTSIDMPGMNGIDLIAHLRQLHSYRAIPIMMLATEAQSGSKIAGRRVGATGWIGKPFDRQRFIAIVRQVCPID